MLKITTIGGGNGQSTLLDGFFTELGNKVKISSIVSMSDDGRTTGKLMKSFENELNLHLPPPGDLRRCLFSLSESEYRDYFKLIFEYTFLNEESISEFTIMDLFKQVNKELLFFGRGAELKEELIKFVNFCKGNLFEKIDMKCKNVFKFKLPLKVSLKGHKFGNILMASLYYNLEKGNNDGYEKMIDFMHELLEVRGKVIPVTTKRAYIKAILGNGEVVNNQDRISNVADYNSGIADLELKECSKGANHNISVHKAIINADYIVVGPGDLFTSIISNFIIGGVKNSIKCSKAKVIYIGNSTNKGGETTGLTQLDFVNKIERFLGKNIDYFVLNNKKLKLDVDELKKFKNNISIKGGDYLFLSRGEKEELEKRNIKVIEANLLSKKSLYKHSRKKLIPILEKIIFNKK
ncbi:2-phospho-L-lactate transferase CofD family protein [Candidatus Gracilibacteria bacterium]|nr:2-phospho-L-lactate transferase CofD family protein [Candidatus Gracilibacteria bacterium]